LFYKLLFAPQKATFSFANGKHFTAPQAQLHLRSKLHCGEAATSL
jgi:hypothetical protein